MTSVFEVHFTFATDFLAEFVRDADKRPDAFYADSEGKPAIVDDIVRLAIRYGPAVLAQVDPTRSYDHRVAANHRSVYVEASYIARGQLVKLSQYVGLETRDEPAPDTKTKMQDVLRQLQQSFATRPHIEVRGGAFFVEEGIWQARPDGTGDIVTPAPQVCATCRTSIYFANDAWRHKESLTIPGSRPGFTEADLIMIKAGREEAVELKPCPNCAGSGWVPYPGRGVDDERCPDCRIYGKSGMIEILHHVADPDVADRKV